MWTDAGGRAADLLLPDAASAHAVAQRRPQLCCSTSTSTSTSSLSCSSTGSMSVSVEPFFLVMHGGARPRARWSK
eukprot:SAG31_NODE_11647_length_1010_cov_1.913282_2_plen_75_part_00